MMEKLELEEENEMIRRTEISDIPKLVEMKLKMFEESGHSNLLCDNSYEKICRVYEQLYIEEKACHFVIEEQKSIVACCGGFLNNNIPYCFFKTDFYGFIGDVYTIPQERGKGYATALTKRTIEWLSEKGAKEIRLLASEQGRSIYEKIGFTSTDEMVLTL